MFEFVLFPLRNRKTSTMPKERDGDQSVYSCVSLYISKEQCHSQQQNNEVESYSQFHYVAIYFGIQYDACTMIKCVKDRIIDSMKCRL